jgi:hypothetical protein
MEVTSFELIDDMSVNKLSAIKLRWAVLTFMSGL